jgi:hypothetical protein
MVVMDELTIKNIENILGWSYPTALAFAKLNGRQDEAGKWFVPAEAVDSELKNRERLVNEQRRAYENTLAIPA